MNDTRRPVGPEVRRAAELFKALSAPLRVEIVQALSEPHTVSELVERTGASQPLISQHLAVLRSARLVTVTRSGREASYAVADDHVLHVVRDAISHAGETGD